MSSSRNADPTDWEGMWARGLRRGEAFDGNGASPALKGFLSRRANDVTDHGGSQLRALVPGCGRAYDAILLASAGFSVDAWDIAPTAVQNAAEIKAEAPVDIAERVNVEHRNFFDEGKDGEYDLVWDCTFLCALPISQRDAWAERQAALVKTGGCLVSLVFPIFPDNHPKVTSGSGPPFALNDRIIKSLLENRGFELQEDQSLVPLPRSEHHLPGKMDVQSGLLVFKRK